MQVTQHWLLEEQLVMHEPPEQRWELVQLKLPPPWLHEPLPLQVFAKLIDLSYKIKGFRVGATAYKSLYGIDLVKDAAPYQYYDFQGNNNFNAGVDASYANKYLSVFGEFSMSQNGGKALLVGSIFNLHPRLTFSVLYRNFARDYQVFYAVPFSEGSRAQNEKGIYLGAVINTGTHSNFKVYYDIYSFDWLRYRVNAPSQGDEFSLLYENRPNRHFNFNIRYRNENKKLNESADNVAIRAITQTRKQSLRFHINYSPFHQVQLKRCQVVWQWLNASHQCSHAHLCQASRQPQHN